MRSSSSSSFVSRLMTMRGCFKRRRLNRFPQEINLFFSSLWFVREILQPEPTLRRSGRRSSSSGDGRQRRVPVVRGRRGTKDELVDHASRDGERRFRNSQRSRLKLWHRRTNVPRRRRRRRRVVVVVMMIRLFRQGSTSSSRDDLVRREELLRRGSDGRRKRTRLLLRRRREKEGGSGFG